MQISLGQGDASQLMILVHRGSCILLDSLSGSLFLAVGTTRSRSISCQGLIFSLLSRGSLDILIFSPPHASLSRLACVASMRSRPVTQRGCWACLCSLGSCQATPARRSRKRRRIELKQTAAAVGLLKGQIIKDQRSSAAGRGGGGCGGPLFLPRPQRWTWRGIRRQRFPMGSSWRPREADLRAPRRRLVGKENECGAASRIQPR